MTGDVNGAFRNIPVSAYHVGRFAGTIPELRIFVIDLCCPFGWKIHRLPIGQQVLQLIIFMPIPLRNGRYNQFLPVKTSTLKRDDHISTEPDIGSCLTEADIVYAVPCTCHEKKFSGWFTRGRALGLDWDLEALTGSMPASNVLKALHRISD
ncbi:hypothetical protein PHMEG_00020372 [Phytophthora megakarya]|uniref:Uncharacterized protein n=1 Tax=Phytophthora megakarya TaxID=4795 RepID=A0A225VP29_9STRA|nr:hypothetical protein PHMEG_00020372 [Phytophthora megakarya]